MLCNGCVLAVDIRVGSFFVPFLPTYSQRTFPQVFTRNFLFLGRFLRRNSVFTPTFVSLTTKTICSLILIILIRAEE